MIKLRKTDRTILLWLSGKVRLFTAEQLAPVGWSGNVASCQRRLCQLAAVGLLNQYQTLARNYRPPQEPMIRWQQGDAAPDHKRMSEMLKTRWKRVPVRPITYFVATSSVRRRCGGISGGRLAHPLQASHDLSVSHVFLSFVANRLLEVEGWIGEDSYEASEGQQVPDAIVLGTQHSPALAVEIGGLYSPERLRRFHKHCLGGGLDYELY